MTRIRFLTAWWLAFVASFAQAATIGGELKQAQLEKLSSDPTGSTARVYFNTTESKAKIYDGTAWGSLGSGSGGEANYVTHPSDAVSWTETGTVFDSSPTTTTSSSDLPLSGVFGTALKLTSSTSSAAESAGYVSFAFTTGAGGAGKNKIEFYMRPGTNFIASEWTVSLYQSTTRLSLSTDVSAVSYLPVSTGRFVTYVDLSASTAYTLRFARVANAGANAGVLNLAGVTVGPGIRGSGSIVSEWVAFTPSFASVTVGTGGSTLGYYRQVGDSMEVFAQAILGSSGSAISGIIGLTIPDGKTVDTTKVGGTAVTSIYGMAHGLIAASNYWSGAVIHASSTLVRIISSNTGDYWKATVPGTWANNDKFSLRFTVPITEWAGGGTLNVANVNKQSPVKAGVVMPYAGSTAPTGWVLCDGSTYAQTTYPDLYAAIGTTYATQTNPTTGASYSSPSAGNFRVPDYRGVFLRGVGTGSGLTAVTLGGYQADQNLSHTHTSAAPANAALYSGGTARYAAGANSTTMSVTNLVIDAAGGDEARPRNIGINYIIKLWNDSIDVAGFAQVSQTGSGLVKSAGQLLGTNTNDSAAAGYVGEEVRSYVESGSAVVLTNNVTADVTSISLTAGDWDVTLFAAFSGTPTGTQLVAGVSTTSGNSTTGLNLGDTSTDTPTMPTSASNVSLFIPVLRVSVSSTTTYYYKARARFTAGAVSASGRLTARRVR